MELKMPIRLVNRITIYTPPPDIEKIISAILKFARLDNGPYEEVLWFSSESGTEQFRPTSNANPTLGKEGKLERAASLKLEFSVSDDESLLEKVLSAAAKAHPWERPVIIVSKEYEWYAN